MCTIRRIGTVLWIVCLLLAALVHPLHAHGGTGTQQINNEDIGPYRVFVWSDPDPPQVGEYHVAVALTESLPDDPSGFAGKPIFDADVTVTLTHLESGQAFTDRATHENAANKVYYEARFQVPEPGEWQVQVAVQGAEGTGEVAYVDRIEAARFNWMPLAGGVLALLLLAAALVVHWRIQPQPTLEAS